MNTPAAESEGTGGWAVAAVVIILVVLVALFVWPGFARPVAQSQPQQPGASINVTLPSGGNTGGNTGGTGGTGNTGGSGAQQ